MSVVIDKLFYVSFSYELKDLYY